MKSLILITATLFISFSTLANAKDCSILLGKTYMPRGPGKIACDNHDLPAEFAGNLDQFSSEMASLGYKVTKFDQCAKSAKNEKEKYVIASQLGDCEQTGFSMKCSLFVALIDAKNGRQIYSNTITASGIGSVSLELGVALANLPACANLN